MSFLGLDIGTGACKAVAFDMNGNELANAIREYTILHPGPGMAELNSQNVIESCFDVIREVNQKITDPVDAMSISSQGEAFTPVAHDGSYLANAMVSSDVRAIDIVAEWNQTFDVDHIYKITGHTPHPLFTLFKILWLKKNQPEIWREARY